MSQLSSVNGAQSSREVDVSGTGLVMLGSIKVMRDNRCGAIAPKSGAKRIRAARVEDEIMTGITHCLV